MQTKNSLFKKKVKFLTAIKILNLLSFPFTESIKWGQVNRGLYVLGEFQLKKCTVKCNAS